MTSAFNTALDTMPIDHAERHHDRIVRVEACQSELVAAVVALRRREFSRSADLLADARRVDWSTLDDESLVLAVLEGGVPVATMAGAVLRHPDLSAELHDNPVPPEVPASAGIMLLRRAATDHERRSVGFNSLLRWHFLRAAIEQGLEFLVGDVQVGASRVALLERMGYRLHEGTWKYPWISANGGWIAVLNLKRDGERALAVLEPSVSALVAQYRCPAVQGWNGFPRPPFETASAGEPSIHVRLGSDRDREPVQHLRYQVFTEEIQDTRHADHQRRTYGDDWDDHRSLTLIAENSRGQLVGTLRLSLRRHGPYFDEAANAFDALAGIVGIDLDDLVQVTAVVSRGAVHAAWRGRGVFARLLVEAESCATTAGVTVLVGAVGLANAQSKRVFVRQGYASYGTRTNQSQWAGEYFFKTLPGAPHGQDPTRATSADEAR